MAKPAGITVANKLTMPRRIEVSSGTIDPVRASDLLSIGKTRPIRCVPARWCSFATR